MHEYRLYTSIPTPRKTQVLNIFAGITASQPVATVQQVLIYQQLKAENIQTVKKGLAKPAAPVGQQQRLNYVKLVRNVAGAGGAMGKWRLREEGLPDPAAKTVISQSVVERDLDESEMVQFRSGSASYKYVSQCTSSGVRFVYHNIVIYITRLYNACKTSDAEPPEAPPTALDNSTLLDPSGAWLVEVCVRVDDGSNSGLRDKAVKELEGFKRELEGAVDLRVPDRLALDPRVR